MASNALAPYLRAFSHELRQPLTVAQFAADQCQRALDRLTIKLQAFDWLAEAMIDETAARDSLRPRAVAAALAEVPQLGIELHQSIRDDLCVLAAPGTFEMVLESLLNNARKHAPGAAVTVCARVITGTSKPWPARAPVRLTGPAVLVTVLDNGPGVRGERRADLFDPIKSNEWAGLRIGLWLCQLIVRAHGGDIWLDDTPSGASFSSIWPLAPSPGRPSDSHHLN